MLKVLFLVALMASQCFGAWKLFNGTDTVRANVKVAAPLGDFDKLTTDYADTASFPCTAYGGSWGIYKDTIGIAHCSKIGQLVTIAISLWAIDVTGDFKIKGIPWSWRPNQTDSAMQSIPFPSYGNGGSWLLMFNVTKGEIEVFGDNENGSSAVGRILRPCFSYMITDYAW